jgi:hypothetical protein
MAQPAAMQQQLRLEVAQPPSAPLARRTYGNSSAISRSSDVSFNVTSTRASCSLIHANSLFSPTLKTGNPQGASSYDFGNDNANARMLSECDMTIHIVSRGVYTRTLDVVKSIM